VLPRRHDFPSAHYPHSIFSPFISTFALVFPIFPLPRHSTPNQSLSLIIRFVIGCRNDLKDLRFNWFYLSAKRRPPEWTRETISSPRSGKRWTGWVWGEGLLGWGSDFGGDARQLHWFTWQLRGRGPEKMHTNSRKSRHRGDSLSPLPTPCMIYKTGLHGAQEADPISLSWGLLKANHKRLHTEVEVVQPFSTTFPLHVKSWARNLGATLRTATELLPGCRNFRLHSSK